MKTLLQLKPKAQKLAHVALVFALVYSAVVCNGVCRYLRLGRKGVDGWRELAWGLQTLSG
jgi:hypothetical protein